MEHFSLITVAFFEWLTDNEAVDAVAYFLVIYSLTRDDVKCVMCRENDERT